MPWQTEDSRGDRGSAHGSVVLEGARVFGKIELGWWQGKASQSSTTVLQSESWEADRDPVADELAGIRLATGVTEVLADPVLSATGLACECGCCSQLLVKEEEEFVESVDKRFESFNR